MSTIGLTSAQRRQMQKLGSCVDEVVAGDRIYFENHPLRRHRIRASHHCEIAQNEIIEGKPWTPPPGWRWITAVRNVASGARTRLFTTYHDNAETDVTEDVARQIFERLETESTREFEANVVQAMGGRSCLE